MANLQTVATFCTFNIVRTKIVYVCTNGSFFRSKYLLICCLQSFQSCAVFIGSGLSVIGGDYVGATLGSIVRS